MTVTQSTFRLTSEDINRFIETGKSEDTTVDFKLERYKANDDGRKDFVKDVTAFANSQGGHLIIGVKEEEGIAVSVKPIVGGDWDREILRLENLCQDCIEPKVMGIEIYTIQMQEGEILAVKVPKSWAAPHRAQSKKSKTFYQRHSRSISEMDVSQLREAFIGSSTAFDKAARLSERWTSDVVTSVENSYEQQSLKDFDQKKTETLWTKEQPSLKDGILTLHIIPIGSMLDRTSFPIEALEGKHEIFSPIAAMGCSSIINLMGVRYFMNHQHVNVYTQLHRFGAVEAVTEQLLWQRDGGRALLVQKINQELKEKLPRYFNGIRGLGASPPLFVKMRISRVKNSTMDTGSFHGYFSHGEPEFTDETIELPDIVLTDYPDTAGMDAIGKKLLDPLWNAYGRARCFYFSDEGIWLNSD